MLRAEAVRAMATRSDKRIILTDASKFNRRGVVQLMPTHQITHVITDNIPDNCRAALENGGVEILVITSYSIHYTKLYE